MYRIAWAAYRNADVKLVIKLLLNFKLIKHYTNIRVKNLITTDAVEILSNALFEQNDITFTEKHFHRIFKIKNQ